MDFRISLIRKWNHNQDPTLPQQKPFRCPCCKQNRPTDGAWFAKAPYPKGEASRQEEPVLICSHCSRLTHWAS